MPDVNNIQPNSRVRVADVTVGHVTKIERQGWHALVTMQLNGDVVLPANATAKFGQTSLLGSLHIELAPPTDEPPRGQAAQRLADPAVHARHLSDHRADAVGRGRCCSTAGDSASVQDITEAFSTAFSGREGDLRSLIGQPRHVHRPPRRPKVRHHRRQRQPQQPGRPIRRTSNRWWTRR